MPRTASRCRGDALQLLARSCLILETRCVVIEVSVIAGVCAICAVLVETLKQSDETTAMPST